MPKTRATRLALDNVSTQGSVTIITFSKNPGQKGKSVTFGSKHGGCADWEFYYDDIAAINDTAIKGISSYKLYGGCHQARYFTKTYYYGQDSGWKRGDARNLEKLFNDQIRSIKVKK